MKETLVALDVVARAKNSRVRDYRDDRFHQHTEAMKRTKEIFLFIQCRGVKSSGKEQSGGSLNGFLHLSGWLLFHMHWPLSSY